ncbi:MAG: hypothetical protein JSW42_05430 [Chloroflexota bacterium]|nr:MAG: hypothetical protein JSW42_05430 [Chloroflexota bacterium]
MKKPVIILAIVLVLTFMVTLTASATKPTEISGFFYFVPPYGPNDYCIATGDNYVPDGFLVGCVDQPVKPGLGAHGTIEVTLDGELTGTCEYNLRTYDIDGIARAVFNRCDGDLAGFHVKAVGWAANGLWEGSYHFDP